VVALDCHFEDLRVLQYFGTTVTSRPTLQARRDDAEGKGRVGNFNVFVALLSAVDTEAR
jgi:hypothetical protein